MNEEWFGITGKSSNNDDGTFDVQPRPAYFALQRAFELDPYKMDLTKDAIADHYRKIMPASFEPLTRAYQADAKINALSKAFISDARFLMSFHGSTRPELATDDFNQTKMDHMQSLYTTFTFNPSSKLRTNATLNVIGNVAQNRIDELFLRKPGKAISIHRPGRNPTLDSRRRTNQKFTTLTLNGKPPWGKTTGYFRKGHFHWGNEGDFFGFYPEAYYGPNIDIYNVDVPLGLEIEGKKMFDGLKIAAGPQVLGANPLVMAKYYRRMGNWDFAPFAS